MAKLLNKLFLATTLFVAGSLSGVAQTFNDYFVDETLRLDYAFAGNAEAQSIALDELVRLPGWYGRRARLAELPMEGNGQITVRDHTTQRVVYRHSFSTLFQEWITYDEAQTLTRSFENVFLVPMPRDTVDITVELFNVSREVATELTHTVVPNDILIHSRGYAGVTPYDTLVEAADPAHSVKIAFVAEGYTEAEMDTFLADVQEATDALFAHEPFRSLRDRFNIIAVKSPSRESGTSVPRENVWRDTALSSHFDTFYSARYLTTLQLKTLHNILAGTPYEHIIILVNTDRYGGGGILNSYNLAMTHHYKFRPVVVHEFGHSFAGLADEYAYDHEDIALFPEGIEPWEDNITRLVDFSAKWQDMLDRGDGIGLYEGAGYQLKGMYRAYPDCRMRTNEEPEFCAVCQRTIRRVVDFYTNDASTQSSHTPPSPCK